MWTPTIEFPGIRVSHAVFDLSDSHTVCGERVPRGYAIRSRKPYRPDCHQCERILRIIRSDS